MEALGKLQHLDQTQMHSHTQDLLNPPHERKASGTDPCDSRLRTGTFGAARRLTNTTMTLIWCFSWPNLSDKGNKCLCAARLSHMVARRTSSHQFQRTCARMCVAQNADMLRFPDGSFSRIPRRIFEQIFPNLPVTLQRCPAACRMVPTTTNLCLISHFRLPFHFHTPVDLCARRSGGATNATYMSGFHFYWFRGKC